MKQQYILTMVVTVDFAAYATEFDMEGEPQHEIGRHVREDLRHVVEYHAATIRESPAGKSWVTVGRADVTATT